MGIGIINCFMIVLAFVAIPTLLHDYSTPDSRENDINEHQLGHMQQVGSNLNKPPPIIDTYH